MSSVVGILDLVCPAGATFERTLTYKLNGAAVNLTGWTARMQVRQRHIADTALLDLTTANGGITLGGAAGTISLLATDTQTGALPEGVWRYDLELIDGSGKVKRLVEGSFTVTPQVTR